jgi:hypothetical protein
LKNRELGASIAVPRRFGHDDSKNLAIPLNTILMQFVSKSSRTCMQEL